MADQAGGPGEAGQERQHLFLLVACIVALVATSFSFIIRIMLMGQWQIEFALSETQKGEILGAGFWPFGVSIVLFSLLIDKVGYGKSMIFAFACHVVSAILLVSARSYTSLYAGSILNGLAAGTVEAAINPAIATAYPKSKTKMLSILHAGWPGGLFLAGLLLLLLNYLDVNWRVSVAAVLVPVILYGILLLRARFPVSERVAAGIPYRDMLKEAGAITCLIVLYLITSELNNQFNLPTILQVGSFTLPCLPFTILIGLLTLGYLAYTGSLGRPMYILLVLVMILLATTELGIDGWITDLMKPPMAKLGLASGFVLVYTALIMTILRFCIGPIERALKPLGVLLASAILASAGLFLLSGAAAGGAILVFATVYGFGKTFFWPCTLGVVAERFPKGGALTLNAISGVGMLGVGVLGLQILGYWQDTRIDRELKATPAIHAAYMAKDEKRSIFGSYRSLDPHKVAVVDDAAALYERRQAVAEKKPGADIDKALADDDTYKTIVRNAVEHQRPAEPAKPADDAPADKKAEYEAAKKAYDEAKKTHDEATKSFGAQVAFLDANKMILRDDATFKALKADAKDTLDKVRGDAKRNAMSSVAILPAIMAICYLALILYFSATGGYKAIDLMAEKKEGH